MHSPLAETNWSGNHAYRADTLQRPSQIDQIQQLVADARSIRALGSRHAFTAIGDAETLVSMGDLPAEITVDRAAGTVSVAAGVTYAQLAHTLNREGLALHSLASLPHISVAGAVATASHGSGDRTGNLATAVTGVELVAGHGELVSFARGDPDFEGVVVGLGALGIATRMTLSVQPYYEVSQRVFEGLTWDGLFEHFDAITASGESVSVFHRFGERTEQLWIKSRVDRGAPTNAAERFGVLAANGPRHPIPGTDPVHCTEQLGVPGPWSERLPHFRSGFTPSSGEEIQSEFFVAREQTVAAIEALRSLSARITPLLLIAELRTIAADQLWLSPHYRRASVGLHFTWMRSQPAVESVLHEVEAALAPFSPRPHWGKLFTARADTIAPAYERLSDFRRLRRTLDPRDVFGNEWLRTRVLADP